MVRIEPCDNESRHQQRSSLVDFNPHHQASAPGMVVYWTRHIVREIFDRTGWWESQWAVRIRKYLRGRVFAVIAIVSLFLALFLSEVFAVAQVATNTVLDIILTVVFAIFTMEFVGLAMTDTSYLLGFFFWMDLLGTASMIFDISYMAGKNVEQPVLYTSDSGSNSQQSIIVVRATRAAKLGARAGRISRVLKILRFLPFLLKSSQDDKVKIAKVISNQLTNGLSTRVAFLTICIVIILPLFSMFTYPEEDDSMMTWAELLNRDGQLWHNAVLAGDDSNVTLLARFQNEISYMRDYYSDKTYGPFSVQCGQTEGGIFVARPDVTDQVVEKVSFSFSSPQRLSSSRLVSHGFVQTSFNLATPVREEAASAIGLVCFIILTMCCFGLFMSSSISVVALQPLERMLSVVRQRCTQIFRYTDTLKDDSETESGDEKENYDDMEHDSEFVLLEKVVAKLAAIAHLSSVNQQVEVKEDMSENEIMQLGWLQGEPVAVTHATMRMSKIEGRRTLGGGESIGEIPERATSLTQETIEALSSPYFDSSKLTTDEKIAVAVYLLVDANGPASSWSRSNVSELTMWTFIRKVASEYMDNPFHNFAHAIDVQYTVMRNLHLIEADIFLFDTVQFALSVSALGHDVGHMGVNNQFLIETSNELAVLYNDRSPLENMHCSKLFRIMHAPETNILGNVDKEIFKEIRKSMILFILHTDVTKHNEMVKDAGMLYQMNSEAFDKMLPDAVVSSHGTATSIGAMLLHSADVGNPCKPWLLCKNLAYLCMDEFFAQGDMEKSRSIPVQMLNDREKVNRPNAQIGFIEFFIAPLVTEMVHLFPGLHEYASTLGENIRYWSEVWQEETQPAEAAAAKVAARVQRLDENMGTLADHAMHHVQTRLLSLDM